MFAELLQYLLSGLTIGAIYALAGLGFSIIYNASHVINFAQGEFIMIGGMASATLTASGVPLPLAIMIGCGGAMLVGVLVAKFAVERARNASTVTLIIITIGASIFLRGVAELVWGKDFKRLDAFSGETPIQIMGASMQPQSLWVVGTAGVLIVAIGLFFARTLTGKAILATSHNRLAAQLVGIDVKRVVLASFALSAALGAVGGAVVAPITFSYTEMGIMLGLKGFTAAVLGGLGHGPGAVAGGLIVGIAEALGAGYISSAYKDAVAFVIILAVLLFMPNGLFGKRGTERV
ncbi:branched-chain amino acid ABC transporter permease [Azospirillum melinis]|uniref:Branched-chain amino acid ABC transporter permease n=1 Tax=Azospirillum melinis TaxID=328839 RepID=A0ABX2KAF6_9PROT|nr:MULTISPECIES: branched-chain amino acid ABC transporter permease [Azospirillum]MBP2304929.1 branched-chain amino acid transport system permease protein [Azospirillum melinis]NUA99682.1 branched-chain amino acid ABC transporter permease [Azospirillum melinis]PWC46707.1 ABC transporter permease [Azospirillum sp. TSA6c]PWC75705.1 ABC transporter permease [Azospirillum sp. TSH64]